MGKHKEYIDIIQEKTFREETFSFLRKGLEIESYSVPDIIPRLYKYRALSKNAVEDIIQQQFTPASIEEFNDVFDGAIHIYPKKRRKKPSFCSWTMTMRRKTTATAGAAACRWFF